MSILQALKAIMGQMPDETSLWEGPCKIPWDDPGFSERMLKEHLSQEHSLASRKSSTIQAQAQWIHAHILDSRPSRILDLGCGPGLYIRHFSEMGHDCTGMDISPASIAYARKTLGSKARFIHGDVRREPLGQDHDAALMLYGEINVFSPSDCKTILEKCRAALAPGGRLVLEPQRFEAVQAAGEAPGAWYKSGEGLAGLFSGEPYLCLTENRWFEEAAAALQVFHVIDVTTGQTRTHRSVTKAWTGQELTALLEQAGFSRVTMHPGWPAPGQDLLLVSAVK